MSCIKGILSSICPEVESQVKNALGGFITGSIVRGYLPQFWVLRTEHETVTFSVDSMGNASAFDGLPSHPDVVIDWKHDYVAMALRNRSKAGIPSGEQPNVTFMTRKGRTAFGYLRGRLGL